MFFTSIAQIIDQQTLMWALGNLWNCAEPNRLKPASIPISTCKEENVFALMAPIHPRWVYPIKKSQLAIVHNMVKCHFTRKITHFSDNYWTKKSVMGSFRNMHFSTN